MHDIGTVQAIFRYPVKSMSGERLSSATLRWQGLDGDRQYAFYRTGSASRFPWLTGRDVSALVTWKARYAVPDDPRRSPVRVETGNGEHGLDDPALRERLTREAGQEIRLLQVGRGTFDSMPVSVLSTCTLELLEAAFGRAVDPVRFRANILIAPTRPARETEWTGGTLAFGDRQDAARLQVNVPIRRCSMITLDPATAVADPALLRCVVDRFDNEIGVYGATRTPGTIAVGDVVRLEQA